MQTIVKTASVKVMQSYDYCHFEASMTIENENGLSLEEIDAKRKDCQRLTDKAVAQFKTAKVMSSQLANSKVDRERFLKHITQIQGMDECDRTIQQIAMLKQYEDNEWQAQFQRQSYDYDNDDDFGF
jgi:hypothetical protein